VSRTDEVASGTFSWTVTFSPDSFSSVSYALPTLESPPASWDLTGTGAQVTIADVTTAYTSVDLTPWIDRCDDILVGGQYFKVHATALFDDTVIPLASPADCHVTDHFLRNTVNAVVAKKRPQTVLLDSHTTAAVMEAALNQLPTTGVMRVSSVSSPPVGKVSWQVTFSSQVGPQQLLVLNPFRLVGGSGTVAAFRPGLAPSNHNSTVVPPLQTMMSYVIRNLTPGVNYYVRVSGLNDKGSGPFAATVPDHLPPLNAPSAPSGLTLSATSILASFEEFANSNSCNWQTQVAS
jgi:hypothetical protein